MMQETATLGGGCFWCLEAVFERLAGVERVVSGYAGGHTAHPTYREVSGGRTGHAEVVQVTFDPSVLPYRELLELFFAFHDPTTPDQQGPDFGPQYRSIVLAHSEDQARTAREVIAALEGADTFGAPVVTEVKPLERFWPAEPGHQEYYRRNPDQPYCRAMITPKLAKLRAKYAGRLRPATA
jgi:peptide-methionine (S)-S-oxide reductase